MSTDSTFDGLSTPENSFLLGPPALPRPERAPILQVYPDLFASQSFRIRQDHASRRLYVSGFVGNRGNQAAPAHVKVAVGVAVRIAGKLISTQRVYTMGKNLRPGEFQLTDPPTVAPLAYYNEDNGAKYLFEILVDFNHEVLDVSRGNNYSSYTWYAYDPQAVNGDEPFTFGNFDERNDSTNQA